mgnify:CR=1 FL=1
MAAPTLPGLGRAQVKSALTGEATEVTLTHVGWERLADADAQRRGYDTGWDVVLGADRDAS